MPLRIKEINSNGDVRYHEADSPEPFHVESDQIHNGQAILKVCKTWTKIQFIPELVSIP